MIWFLIVAAALAFGFPPFVSFLHNAGSLSSVPSFLYESTWLVALITTILFVYLVRFSKTGHFVQLYLLSMVAKLIAFLAYILIVVLEDRDGATANAVYFLIVYTVYTVLEIAFLYRKISTPSHR